MQCVVLFFVFFCLVFFSLFCQDEVKLPRDGIFKHSVILSVVSHVKGQVITESNSEWNDGWSSEQLTFRERDLLELAG